VSARRRQRGLSPVRTLPADQEQRFPWRQRRFEPSLWFLLEGLLPLADQGLECPTFGGDVMIKSKFRHRCRCRTRRHRAGAILNGVAGASTVTTAATTRHGSWRVPKASARVVVRASGLCGAAVGASQAGVDDSVRGFNLVLSCLVLSCELPATSGHSSSRSSERPLLTDVYFLWGTSTLLALGARRCGWSVCRRRATARMRQPRVFPDSDAEALRHRKTYQPLRLHTTEGLLWILTIRSSVC
jgi:hypothetical protein